jgi:hypothetical protein
MKKKKNIPRAQTTPDMLFGPVFVITTQSNPPRAFKKEGEEESRLRLDARVVILFDSVVELSGRS